MNERKNNLDELQEQKLLKIESNGAWLAFWGLLIAILVQIIMGIGQENLLKNIAAEWIVFMGLALYMGLACAKNGIWDRRLKPNPKTNLVISLISGLVCGLVFFFASYFKYSKLLGSIATGAIMFMAVSFITFVALSASSAAFKKRVAKLESENEEDSAAKK